MGKKGHFFNPHCVLHLLILRPYLSHPQASSKNDIYSSKNYILVTIFLVYVVPSVPTGGGLKTDVVIVAGRQCFLKKHDRVLVLFLIKWLLQVSVVFPITL